MDEFASRLEEAGAPGARDFFAAWARGDSTIAFEVRDVKSRATAEGWEHELHLARTGNVPCPLELRVRDAEGNTVDLEADPRLREQVLRASTPGPFGEVLLDPEGVLPVPWSSDPDVRRLFGSAGEPGER